MRGNPVIARFSATHRPSRFSFVLLTALCLLAIPQARADRLTAQQALASITSTELRSFVELLADDTFEGREAGSRGGQAAAVYLGKQLTMLNLKGGGATGRFEQPFGRGLRNVLAILEGSDPALKNEVVLISAHYDHVGYGKKTNSFGPIGYIHNGADDNASGTAALLELAEAFSKMSTPPKRTIMFALWDGEEAGLLGSKHWAADPTIDIKRIKFVLNMDMIGRLTNNKLEVFGTRTSPGLRRLVSEKNAQAKLDMELPWKVEENSDHAPFFQRNVPVLMLHTGLHNDYHRPSDDAHLINFDGMQKVTRLAFEITNDIVNRPQTPTFREQCRREQEPDLSKLARRALPRPRLGFAWRRDGDAMHITRVTPNLPAAQAGLRVNDVIASMNNKPIPDDATFKMWVLAAEGKVQFQITRPADPATTEVVVQLAGKPTRVGVTWRLDSGEPGTAIVVDLVPGSAADRAGLKIGDRIYEVGKRSFSDSAELQSLLTSLTSPLDLRIERRGNIATMSLDVPPAATSL